MRGPALELSPVPSLAAAAEFVLELLFDVVLLGRVYSV